jgi:very-short-patch-repair endonuclease
MKLESKNGSYNEAIVGGGKIHKFTMSRDFDPKKYWESKPWCSVCGQRKVRYGSVCHQCLAKMNNKKRDVQINNKIARLEESERHATQSEAELNDSNLDVPGQAEAVERKIQQCKERLIDLSLRNRLLNFKQTKSSTLKIMEPRPAVIFDRLVKNEREYYLYELDEQRLPPDLEQDEKNSLPSDDRSASNLRNSNELICEGNRARTARVLYALRSRALTELEERGTNVLFVALGFLRWSEIATSSFQLLSPLVLIPVRLERQRLRHRYQLSRVPEELVVNPALVLKLKNDFGIVLPELPENPEDADLETFLKLVRKATAHLAAWEVCEECQMGLFSFLKFMMYKDLEASGNIAKKHRIVSALAGFPSLLPDIPSDLVTADRLDDTMKSERTFQILDADSSQQEAIAAALAGVSFVLQGPPGTGKSQTIANIIAECLVAGKTVLFVSEKMAALEVVKRRLDQCGLGEFCLELHSHKTNKQAILGQLADTVHKTSSLQIQEKQFPFHELEERRKQLNNFVRSLHTPRGSLKLTPFQVYARLARLWSVPDILVAIPSPLEITPQQFSHTKQLFEQLTAYSSVLWEYETHPWKATILHTCSIQQQVQIEQSLHSFIESLNKAMALEVRLSSLVQNVVERMEAALLTTYTHNLIELALEDLIQRFTGPYRGFGKYIHYPSYRSSMRHINCCYRTSVRTCEESLVADLRLALLISQGRKCFQDKMATLRERDKPKSGMTLSIFNALVSWAKNYLATTSELVKCSAPVALEPTVLQELSEVAREGSEIATALRSGYNFLGTLFHLDEVRIDERNSLVDLRSWVKLRLDRLPDLREWLDVENTIAELRNLGLEEFFRESLKKKVESKALPDAFEKQFLRSWIDEVCGYDQALNSFRSTLHEQAIDEFRKLDKRLVQITPQRVILNLQSRRPDLLFTSPRTSDIGILEREIQKKRRHKTLRRLFAEIPDLIQALKPCFLMSPMSVSSYMVPGKMKFDVLLFDEASQIMPEDAIGSILRSPQVIVVGDTKQLPPTRFFAAIEGDDTTEEEPFEETPLDSIMEEALAGGLREKTLLWHYRSRDESLIAFSNYYFYNRDLITFPSAGTHAFPIGIEFVLVPNAVYDRSRSRTNRREAERVAELVYQHYKQSPNHSLGVVAFSLPQADAIDAAVEVLRKKDEGFDEWCNTDSPEHFFIKNLENVQGDERDVMFLSVGYGPDEQGQITMNFGPLNHKDGQRRLNVAITRAREHVKLISSFDPSQLDLSRVREEGVRLLKEYMEVAKHGVDAITRAVGQGTEGEAESHFEEEVYEALRGKGLQLRKQIGVSGYRIDLGVIDPSQPGRFLLGIECDGATYHSFKTARDRDRLRQQVLENLGWKIHRIWSRDWVQNRQREIDRVLTALK